MSDVLRDRLQFLFDEAESYQLQEDKESLSVLIEEIIAYEEKG